MISGFQPSAFQNNAFQINGAVVPPVVVESSSYYGSGRYNDQLYDTVRSQWEVMELRKRQQALSVDAVLRERQQLAPAVEALPVEARPQRAPYVPVQRSAGPLLLWKQDAVMAALTEQRQVVQPMIEEAYQKIVKQRRRARNRRSAAQIIALLS